MTKTIHYCDCCGGVMDEEMASRDYRLLMTRSVFTNGRWVKITHTDMELCGTCWNRICTAVSIEKENMKKRKDGGNANS
jgi:hypothetical protein